MGKPGNAWQRTVHVLLAEDNRMDIELMRTAFQETHLDHVIHVASGGRQALDYLLGTGQFADRQAHPLPDLILLDLNMPVIDGHEVLRQIKKIELLKRIPVVVLSSSSEVSDLALCYDNGANSYLVKPVSFEGFLEAVKHIVNYWFALNGPPPLVVAKSV